MIPSTLQLSDAIALGRTIIGPCAGGSMDPKSSGYGCVMDMAVVAVGGKNWREAPIYWPWLNKLVGDSTPRSWYDTLIYQFDSAVMSHETMTLDKLIDIVRSVEPPAVVETANQPMEIVHA